MKTVNLGVAVFGALLSLAPSAAQAEGFAARSAAAVRGSHGAAARRGGVFADGQGNAIGGSQRTFATESGTAGASSRGFRRSSDGSFSASSHTSATNANTGATYDGSTSYNKESGFSRSASCRDASGSTVSCGSR